MKKSVFQRYIIPFFIACIVFISTLQIGNSTIKDDWSPRLYGHFIPILKDGAFSLSLDIDIIHFSLELIVFYGLVYYLFHNFNWRLNAYVSWFVTVLFLLVSASFILIISIDLSLSSIEYKFDYSTMRFFWLKNW